MGSFADSVKTNTELAKRRVNAKVYSIMEELFTQVVYSTPVLNGYLRNSWYTQVGGGYSSAVSPFPDKSGSGSLMNIKSLRQDELFYGKDSIVTMTNNQKYAYRIEYLGWSKYKAPYGMVRINLMSVAGKYK